MFRFHQVIYRSTTLDQAGNLVNAFVHALITNPLRTI